MPVSRGMSNSASGVCRLCHKHTELVRSHIIPRFSFKQLKKADGHYFQISNDPNRRERKLQREIREYLFCAKCDNEVLQENEDHLARVLYGGTNLEFRAGRRLAHVRGLDYRKTKNCLLSILWRMGLSSDKFFDEVELGERHSERMRTILLNAEVTDETEYGINICVLFFDEGFIGDWIVPPDFARVGHNRVYRCLIAGILYTFHVGSAELPAEMRSLILRKDGTCPILKANVMEIPFLRHFCLEMAKAQAKRRRK